MELLQRIEESGGQLLRVERAAGDVLLTFDVGRVLLMAEAGGGVAVSPVEAAGSLGPLSDSGEEEPWWRFLGNPLTGAEATEEGLRLRFRPDGQNPRFVQVSGTADGVRARLEGP